MGHFRGKNIGAEAGPRENPLTLAGFRAGLSNTARLPKAKPMPTVLGLDSSTQSLSAVILETGSGAIAHEASVSFGKDLPG